MVQFLEISDLEFKSYLKKSKIKIYLLFVKLLLHSKHNIMQIHS